MEGDDDFGKHVNLAARIAGQASGGEILVSSLLRELTASGGDIEFGDARQVELKGLTGVQEMFPIPWRARKATDVRQSSIRGAPRARKSTSLEPLTGWKKVEGT